jgi:hypothetical protein
MTAALSMILGYPLRSDALKRCDGTIGNRARWCLRCVHDAIRTEHALYDTEICVRIQLADKTNTWRGKKQRGPSSQHACGCLKQRSIAKPYVLLGVVFKANPQLPEPTTGEQTTNPVISNQPVRVGMVEPPRLPVLDFALGLSPDRLAGCIRNRVEESRFDIRASRAQRDQLFVWNEHRGYFVIADACSIESLVHRISGRGDMSTCHVHRAWLKKLVECVLGRPRHLKYVGMRRLHRLGGVVFRDVHTVQRKIVRPCASTKLVHTDGSESFDNAWIHSTGDDLASSARFWAFREKPSSADEDRTIYGQGSRHVVSTEIGAYSARHTRVNRGDLDDLIDAVIANEARKRFRIDLLRRKRGHAEGRRNRMPTAVDDEKRFQSISDAAAIWVRGQEMQECTADAARCAQ